MGAETLTGKIESGETEGLSTNAIAIGATFKKIGELQERALVAGGVEQWVVPEGCGGRAQGQARLVCSDKGLQDELWAAEDRLSELLDSAREVGNEANPVAA